MITENLADMLDRVSLGGAVVECVITIEGGTAIVQAMDMTSTVFIQATCELDHDDDIWGIGDLTAFIKYLRANQGVEVTATHKDNRLNLKPEKGTLLKYLLSDADLIPTYDKEWAETSPIDELLPKFKTSIVMKPESMTEFTKHMKMFDLNTARVTVSSKGIVHFHGGTESEHQFSVNFGKSKMDECELKIYAKMLIAVMSMVQEYDDAKLFLDQDESVLIEIPEATWVIGQIREA